MTCSFFRICRFMITIFIYKEKIPEALEVVPAMLIQCDDIVRKDVKSYQIMKDLEDCSDYELSVIHDILLSLKSSLRENYSG